MPAPRKPPNTTDNDAKKTQPKFDGAKDARKESNALTYPNYHEQRTRSGHVFILDDSNGNESVTLQHRTGSLIQFGPDGAVQITAHNGLLNMVFGENRIVVTGAHDVVVKGSASMLVEGDMNQTIRGDTNFTCDGDFNITAQNMNATIRGNIEMLGKNMAAKIEGAISLTAQGNMAMVSDGDAAFASTSGTVAIGAGSDVGVMGFGAVYVQSGGDTHLYAGGSTSMEASSDINAKSGSETKLASGGKTSVQGGEIAMDANPIHMNSGRSAAAGTAKKAESETTFNATPQPAKETQNFGEMATTKAAYVI